MIDRKNITRLDNKGIELLERKQECNTPLNLKEVFEILILHDERFGEKNSKLVYAMKNIIDNDENKAKTIVEIFNKYCTINHFATVNHEANDIKDTFKYLVNIETHIPHSISKLLIKLSNKIDENKKSNKSKKELVSDLTR